MSGTNSNSPPGGGGDPSMEDILASIRRILAEDEPAQPGAAANAVPGASATTSAVKDDVLVLDSSMLAPAQQAAGQPADMATNVPAATPAPPAAHTPAAAAPSIAPDEAARVLAEKSWPCLEDIVRAGIQPVLREWVDDNIPKLVERMVRTEVERVIGSIT